jgi:hypothetical protein
MDHGEVDVDDDICMTALISLLYRYHHPRLFSRIGISRLHVLSSPSNTDDNLLVEYIPQYLPRRSLQLTRLTRASNDEYPSQISGRQHAPTQTSANASLHMRNGHYPDFP